MPQGCRYDSFRSDLLDIVRARRAAKTGVAAWKENRSLIVMEALDLLLRHEEMLTDDAPPYPEIVLQRKEGGP